MNVSAAYRFEKQGGITAVGGSSISIEGKWMQHLCIVFDMDGNDSILKTCI